MKELRLAAGLTQGEVAKLMDLDQSAVSRWEIGDTFPMRKMWKKLAKLYGVDIATLLEAKGAQDE